MSRNLDHHLHFHGRQWRVRLEIPEPLRPQFGGKRFLVKPLGAIARDQARLLRGPVLSGFELLIAQARNPDNPILKKARMLRRWEEDRRNALPRPDAGDDDAADMMLTDIAAIMGEEHGLEAAETVHKIATGRATPLAEFLEEWLTIRPFRDQGLLLLKARKTINLYLTAYRSYWEWLLDRHRVAANPWVRTNIKQDAWPRSVDDSGPRAFSDEEIVKLLSGDAPEPLPDLMRVAALTGARVEVISILRARDCDLDAATFTFQPAKKEPGPRKVPIHSDLAGLVARRVKGKGADDFLFDELPGVQGKKSSSRSAPASKAFVRYRRSVGVDDRPGEKRRSNVTFHSFRNWFITKAQHANHPEHIVAAVVGHKHPSMTYGHYAGDLLIEQRQACVETVKLPALPDHAETAPTGARGLASSPRRRRAVVKGRKTSA